MKTIIVIGAGAAGMIAALAAKSAAGAGAVRVLLFDGNEKVGKKLFITGKGRCNVTNASDMKTVMENVVSNPKFLYSAFKCFGSADIMKILEDGGCRLKIERGNRVFPVSDHSSDVINTLYKLLKNAGVNIKLNCIIKKLLINDRKCSGVVLANGSSISADAVIVATGGISYRLTGSSGDGYKFASAAGHKVSELYPSLVPLVLSEHDCTRLQGLSLKNVNAAVYKGSKRIYEGFGELLFTHFGVSGPLILSASSYIAGLVKNGNLRLVIDLKPALDKNVLDARILRDFEKYKNKSLKNALGDLLLQSLIPVIIDRMNISPETRVNEIKKEHRHRLVNILKDFEFTITGMRGFDEAVVTKGGVSVKEVEPSSMESKLIKSLYFAGEVLDLDALTGGYNLQIAWSTGWMAGSCAAGSLL
ncbi:NAD(P)/FAD-dependent oxidoreductase [Johnsonella ignava]|uniref:NAD(P)/FAD-dependent oxidoreductase n=1 Tax=Johnsonella ignava TaxID=43995 RepID=UPI0023F2401A|nr:NAD(P)/FAD-dependent oxidoreductase [Johnsonella ignava]